MRFVSKAKCLTGLCLVALTAFAAEWEEPKDGRISEKQLENFLAAQKEILQYAKAAGKALEGSSGLGAAVMLGNIDAKVNGIMEKHNLRHAEFDWLAKIVSECFGALLIDDMLAKGQATLIEQKKKNTTDIAAAKARLAAFETAKKNGTRVLNAEQRESAVKQAKEQEASYLEEARGRADEARTAGEEAAKQEAEAKAADALAAKPPADVEADGKADYINTRKEEAKSARASAKETRDREKELRKSEAESRVKAAAFAKQAQRPEVPATPDEKQQAAEAAEQGITDTKAELETLTQATGLLAEGDGELKKRTAELMQNIKPENLEIFKKHAKEYRALWGIPETK